MQKYCKIIDSGKGLVDVALGADERFYRSIGFELHDVEKGYDGFWYLVGRTPEKPLEQIKQEYEDAIDARLEAFARELYSKGYANAVTYINDPNPIWAAEADYLIKLRSETWQKTYDFFTEVLPKVLSGEMPVPTLDEVFAVLPVPTWPEGSRGHKEPLTED